MNALEKLAKKRTLLKASLGPMRGSLKIKGKSAKKLKKMKERLVRKLSIAVYGEKPVRGTKWKSLGSHFGTKARKVGKKVDKRLHRKALAEYKSRKRGRDIRLLVGGGVGGGLGLGALALLKSKKGKKK